MKVLKPQLGYLLLGLVFWLPIGVAFLVGSYFFGSLEKLGSNLLDYFLPERIIYSGSGVALCIVIMFITGILLKSTSVGRFASTIPVLGTFFLQLGGETMTIDRLMHLTPCLFLYSPTCLSYGWIISEQNVKLDGEKAHIDLMNVYYPNVPTLLTGQVFSVRKETVMRLGNSSREVVDILLYGLRRPKDLQYLPWDNENEQEFQERALWFGVIQIPNEVRTHSTT